MHKFFSQELVSLPRAILAITIIIQSIRVFFGIDFNDEMQYYGELVSLLNSGRLFSSDLFLQQNVYLLLVPIFKPYVLLWGTENLILANRIVFAIFILWIYGQVRRNLVSVNVTPGAAATSALAVTFAIPLANIYAFSYNTVSLGILALCFTEFFVWRDNGRIPRILFWAIAILLLLLVYPPMGVVVGLVFLVRLWIEGDYRLIVRFATTCLAPALILFSIYFQFTTINALTESVAFTRAFGVGQAILSSSLNLLIFSIFLGIVIVGIMINQGFFRGSVGKLLKLKNTYLGKAIILVSIVSGSVVSVIIASGTIPFLYPLATLIIAVMCFIFSLLVVEGDRRQAWLWVSILFVTTSSIMAITSGNGFPQIQWPAMLAAPFFFAFIMTKSGGAEPKLIINARRSRSIIGIGILAVYATIYLENPYRDETVWHQTDSVKDVPAFSHIRMTSNKAQTVTMIKDTLADIPTNSRVMIIGAHPWIYFATSTQPDTDMIFMHTYSSKHAQEILAQKIDKRRPEYIVIAGLTSAEVSQAVSHKINSGQYNCDSRLLDQNLVNSIKNVQTYYEMLPSIRVCRLQVANG